MNQPYPQSENDAAPGSRASAEELVPLVYGQLRKVAQQRLANERSGPFLTATSLVHEVYLRLERDGETRWANRAHFFAAAAEGMRRILIEHARARHRIKRGGDRRRVPLNVVDLAEEYDGQEVLALDEAIGQLAREDEQAARVMQFRFFAGLSVDETAAALGVSPSTVDREWAYGRAWIRRAMSDATR